MHGMIIPFDRRQPNRSIYKHESKELICGLRETTQLASGSGQSEISGFQVSFWIPIALTKTWFSRIVINKAKILLYNEAPSLDAYLLRYFD